MFVVVPVSRRAGEPPRRSGGREAARSAVAEGQGSRECRRTPDAEFVSLEDADAEAAGQEGARRDVEGDDDIEIEETEDDATFIEEEEEGDDDVTDIIGEGREDEEETLRPVSIPAIHRRRRKISLGAIAQLGERLHGMQEVGGSIPPGSTNPSRRESRSPKPKRRRRPSESRLRAAFFLSTTRHRIDPRTGRKSMKGKIGLEEHFAIDDTLNNSKGFFPDNIWVEVRDRDDGSARPAVAADGRARHGDDDPVAERAGGAGDPRCEEGQRDRAQGQRLSRRAGAQAARSLPGARRAADAGSRSGGRGTAALRQGARLRRRAGQRLLADRRSPTPSSIYDEQQYWPFWAAVEELDVPFYLHPRNPLPRDARSTKGTPG